LCREVRDRLGYSGLRKHLEIENDDLLVADERAPPLCYHRYYPQHYSKGCIMAKVNISLPDGLLDEVNRRADASDTTRSGFLQEAAARYIASLDQEAENLARSRRVEAAAAKMREIGSRIPADPSGADLVRRFRDAPEPWLRCDKDEK
jgi:hypothetical protein